MEWKCFFAIPAYILTTCDLVLGANTIINVTLVDGEAPNEGRVEYLRSEYTTWESACGDGLGSAEASVVCRQLGYPGANNFLARWAFGTGTTVAQERLNCDGNEENLADCPLVSTTSCTNKGGVSCYESGYTGCYPYPASTMSSLGDLQTPCENGLQDSTIPNCVSLCHASTGSYTYAGLYQGNMCLCGKASTNFDQSTKEADRFCSSPCTGRTIETCGGANHIALFNISLYLQNTKRTASSSKCAGPTPTQTAGDESTTVSIQSSSSSSTTPPATPPSSSSSPPSTSPSSPPSPSSPSSPPPTSTTVPSTDRTPMEVSVHSIELTTTVHAVSESNKHTQSTRELVTTNVYSTSSTGTSTQSENCTCPPKGVQIGLIVVVVALLLYAVYITFLHIQFRRKVPTRTGENEPDHYMDLQPRSDEDRTYQEMAITSTASSKKPGERRLPSSNLVYENQNVAQYANKIKKGADYEDVLNPNY